MIPPRYKQVVLVEGVFDAIALYQLGYSAVSLGGTSLDLPGGRQLLQINAGAYAVWLDPDALPKSLLLARKLQGFLGVPVRAVTQEFCREWDPAEICQSNPGIVEALLA